MWPRPPFEPCSTIATVSPNYVADWCGKRAPNGYEAFRKALADYRAAINDVVNVTYGVINDLTPICDGGHSPANPTEVDLIVQRLSFSGRPAVDRAAVAWNAMKSAQKKAFAGDPNAPAVGVDIDALKGVIEGYGKAIMMIETTGDLFAACNSEQTWQVASESANQNLTDLATVGAQSIQIAGDIQMAFQDTQDKCSSVKVRERIPNQLIQKSGEPKTSKSGGSGLTYPKTLKVGKKAVKLPVNVTSPGSGYGTVTLTLGSKDVVATGGWFESGTFGLLMTVPGKTKTGKATLRFWLEGGPTVKAKIKLS